MKYILLVAATLLTTTLFAQNGLKLIIKDSTTNQYLKYVTVHLTESQKTKLSDSTGTVTFKNIPNGTNTVNISSIGYKELKFKLTFPLEDSFESTIVFLIPQNTELDQIIVSSTRTSRSTTNTPTRVEIVDAEELDEKNNMSPANVSMLLSESTGIQVQQTSATSGSASIRLQGLDGKYTQLLKDGYPNFGNFASGLSILEIPPLDLQQVEVIKGPASTLYGAGAIAGVVNFISKTPKEKAEYNLILNRSDIAQTNIGLYASQKRNKFGYTVLALSNFQKAYDVDKDGFSDVPKSNNFTINPQIFYYPTATTTIVLGNSLTAGNNLGGDMQVINGNADSNHVYYEKNITTRNTTILEFDKKLINKASVKIKQSLSFFKREIDIPNYIFSGTNTNSFTDASYAFNKNKHNIVSGLNFLYDKFKQNDVSAAFTQNTESFTSGIYIQDTWDIKPTVKLESGVRIDNVHYSNINYNKSQTFFLPRVSVLLKIAPKVSSRITGGLGYKIPTIFTEQTEAVEYQNVLSLNNVTAEKSIGGTADITYKSKIGTDFSLAINQMFFYTTINNALVLNSNLNNNYFFTNADKLINTQGFETNIKLIFKENVKLFVGYTYTDARATYLPGNQHLPLLPKNKLNLALVYEEEKNFKIGLEGYFTDNQFLYNGIKTPSFWEFGAMGEKTFNTVAVFINFENFTDQRQSKYKSVVNPPYTKPTFDDIWNNVDGFVINGGIKIKL
jgi:outer membrane receptor for ferrienterochelin and colicins